MHQNGALSPFWFLEILSHVNNLSVHTIFLKLPFVSNKISPQFHACDGGGWMSCMSAGTFLDFLGGSVPQVDMAGVVKRHRNWAVT